MVPPDEYWITTQPFPPRDAARVVASPPIPTPDVHAGDVDVMGDDAIELIAAPG